MSRSAPFFHSRGWHQCTELGLLHHLQNKVRDYWGPAVTRLGVNGETGLSDKNPNHATYVSAATALFLPDHSVQLEMGETLVLYSPLAFYAKLEVSVSISYISF